MRTFSSTRAFSTIEGTGFSLQKWRVYIVETARGHLYTGISTDVPKRILVHNKGRGAKCLRGQLPVKLVWLCSKWMTKSTAQRLEAHIKKLDAAGKWHWVMSVSCDGDFDVF